jgi:hypothetical protein
MPGRPSAPPCGRQSTTRLPSRPSRPAPGRAPETATGTGQMHALLASTSSHAELRNQAVSPAITCRQPSATSSLACPPMAAASSGSWTSGNRPQRRVTLAASFAKTASPPGQEGWTGQAPLGTLAQCPPSTRTRVAGSRCSDGAPMPWLRPASRTRVPRWTPAPVLPSASVTVSCGV